MRLPFATGGSGFGDAPSSTDQMHAALRALQGEGGYDEDEDSLRDRELGALAVAPGIAIQTTWRAATQGWPPLATEELDAWEAAYSLREDAARGPAERQARLVAAERAIGGAQPARIRSALRAVVDELTIESPSVAQVAAHQATDGHVAQPFVAVGEADYADRVRRTTAVEVLRRQLPARCWGQDGIASPAEALGVRLDAEWGSTARLGRDALGLDGAAPAAIVNPPARRRDYGPGSKLQAHDLNRIQEGLLAHAPDGSLDQFGDTEPGQGLHPFSGVVTDVALTWAGLDWRDRFIVFAWAAGGVDLRPGGAPWPGDTASDIAFLYTGPGGTGDYGFEFHSGFLELYVDSSTGAPTIRRLAAGTYHVVGWFLVTEPLDRLL